MQCAVRTHGSNLLSSKPLKETVHRLGYFWVMLGVTPGTPRDRSVVIVGTPWWTRVGNLWDNLGAIICTLIFWVVSGDLRR